MICMITRTLPGEEAANDIHRALGKANDAGPQNGFISTCLAPLKHGHHIIGLIGKMWFIVVMVTTHTCK